MYVVHSTFTTATSSIGPVPVLQKEGARSTTGYFGSSKIFPIFSLSLDFSQSLYIYDFYDCYLFLTFQVLFYHVLLLIYMYGNTDIHAQMKEGKFIIAETVTFEWKESFSFLILIHLL